MFLYLFLLGAVLGIVSVVGRWMANTNLGAVQISDGYSTPQTLLPSNSELLTFFLSGAQTTGTEKQGFIVPVAGTISDVRAYLTTSPTTSSFILDIMKNGVTVFTTSANRPTIAASGNASTTTLPDVTAVAVGDRLRLDVIQIGSGVAGSNLYCTVTIKVANVA